MKAFFFLFKILWDDVLFSSSSSSFSFFVVF